MFTSNTQKQAAASATLIAGLTALAASAAAEPRIQDFSAAMQGPVPTLYVEAKNGRWQRLADRPVSFRVRIDANAKGVSNYIKHMGVGASESFAMTENGSPAVLMKGLAVKTFGGRGDRNKASATLDVATSSSKLGLGKASEGAIIAACNNLLDQGRSPFQEHRTSSSGHALWAGVLTQYYRGGFAKGSTSAKRNIGLGFDVVCLADDMPFKVTTASLDYSAPGNTCPRKLTIRTVIESNRAGSGTYRRERKGGEPSAWIEFKTVKVGARYLYVKHEDQEVGHVDQVRRIKVKNGPAAPWTPIKIDCDPFKVTHVKYSYKVNESQTCPRQMTINMALHANQKGHAFVRHERQGGAPGKWFKVALTKTTGSYVWFETTTQQVGHVDQVRRLKVKDGIASNWVHVKNSCSPVKPGGANKVSAKRKPERSGAAPSRSAPRRSARPARSARSN